MPLSASDRRPEPASAWRLSGPLEGSYSLALVNRRLMAALEEVGMPVEAAEGGVPRAAVLLVNDFPPFPATYSENGLNLFASYAWEETGYPWDWVQTINQVLDGLTVVSPYVKKVLREAGVSKPIAVVGNGVDHVPQAAPRDQPSERFVFLHVSTGLARKGLDCMLQAYGQAFRSEDAVELIIKTTPNDTNCLENALSAVRDQGVQAPMVTVINEDWTTEALWALMQRAQVLVMPSRAEGFGLPLAEAAKLGVLGLVTDHGGPMAFADAENALLIQSDFAPSQSHLGPHMAAGLALQDSLWLEPRVNALADQMKKAVGSPVAQRQAMAKRMASRLDRDFTWAKVAQRTRLAVDTLRARAERPASTARVGWVSTYNSKCGIATYSAHLVQHLASQGHPLQVFANADAVPLAAEAEPGIRRLWRQQSFMWSTLAGGLWAHGCDQVVFQHNPGLYPTTGLAQMGAFLAGLGRQCYADLHATDELEAAIQKAPQTLGQLQRFKRLFVHSVKDMNRLKALGLADQACLFPHGVYPPATESQQEAARVWLMQRAPWLTHAPSSPGGPSDMQPPLLACFGFVMRHKGFEQLLAALARMDGPQAPRLLMLTALYPAEDSRLESERLDGLVTALGLSDRVLRVTEFLPEALAVALMAETDLAVYPYQHSEESASGAVRMALAAHCPVAVTPLDIFADVDGAVTRLPGTTAEAIATGLTELLSQPERLAAMRASAKAYAESHQWPRLAQQLGQILQGDWADPFPDGLLDLP